MPIQADILPLQIHTKHILGYRESPEVYYVRNTKQGISVLAQHKERVQYIAMDTMPMTIIESIALPKTWNMMVLSVVISMERGFTDDEQALPLFTISGMIRGEDKALQFTTPLMSGGLLPGNDVHVGSELWFDSKEMSHWAEFGLVIETDTPCSITAVESNITIW